MPLNTYTVFKTSTRQELYVRSRKGNLYIWYYGSKSADTTSIRDKQINKIDSINLYCSKEEVIKEINNTQHYYINELFKLMFDDEHKSLKVINFQSPTGTGKTNMMSLLINKMKDYYFIVTTLSKGELNIQVGTKLKELCKHNNFKVYGLCDFRINSRLEANDIIGNIPLDKRDKLIWIRDEGHIHTNRWESLLEEKCVRIINFSATCKHADIQCNFAHTMMLRTVHQEYGCRPEDAINKLLEIKKQHRKVKGYNPCAIFRCIDSGISSQIKQLCSKFGLKSIDLTDNNSYIMEDLCRDDNEYDVIINKQKITEGIDIRRAHVLYMDNEPKNIATTIQVIGRCRRNALLYRNDIDILSPKNRDLLEQTRNCYVYYNVNNMKVDTDESGELQMEFCNIISVEKLKSGSVIQVCHGTLSNGLTIKELEGTNGIFKIVKDKSTGFNVVKPQGKFYKTIKRKSDEDKFIYVPVVSEDYSLVYYAYSLTSIEKLLTLQERNIEKGFNYATGERISGNFQVYDLREQSTETGDSKLKPLFKIQEGSRGNRPRPINIVRCINLTTSGKDKELLIYADDLIKIKNKYPYQDYTKIINDKQSAIIGFDNMKAVKTDLGVMWVEDKAVTSKINKYSKFRTYLENNYRKYIEMALSSTFNGKNSFEFDSKCNACLGYCVEYYIKYLLYGEDYMKDEIITAQRESRVDFINDNIIVRACMLKYVELMKRAYGANVSKVIRTMSVQALVQQKYHEFVNTVVTLAKNSVNDIRNLLYGNGKVENNYDPNLSINHISGLADFITKDTILDLKVKNCITSENIMQVLAYHYLSTKRSDLDIKHLIVYDAVSNRYVKIDI